REQWVPLVDFDPRSEWAQSLFSPFGTPPVVDIVSLAVGEGENETPYYLTLTLYCKRQIGSFQSYVERVILELTSEE
ncbi:hypothetical protein KQI58_19300, partial [Enterococcus raffinosus]|uniref:hypothetical protein n=1 Tax=Enterococcus raffinosus TaxID=71452 RepID=UPI001C11017C